MIPLGCPLEADNSFGPVTNPGCRDGFDFTLLFEQAIFGLVPAVAFLIISPVRLHILAKCDVRIQFNKLRSAKLVRTSTPLPWRSNSYHSTDNYRRVCRNPTRPAH